MPPTLHVVLPPLLTCRRCNGGMELWLVSVGSVHSTWRLLCWQPQMWGGLLDVGDFFEKPTSRLFYECTTSWAPTEAKMPQHPVSPIWTGMIHIFHEFTFPIFKETTTSTFHSYKYRQWESIVFTSDSHMERDAIRWTSLFASSPCLCDTPLKRVVPLHLPVNILVIIGALFPHLH